LFGGWFVGVFCWDGVVVVVGVVLVLCEVVFCGFFVWFVCGCRGGGGGWGFGGGG